MLKLQSEEKVMLYLLRAGLFLTNDYTPSVYSVDWQKVYQLAIKQGVAAIVYDGLVSLQQDKNVIAGLDQITLMKFYAWTRKNEQRYQEHCAACDGMANVFAKHSIQLMILKGVGQSIYYPVPQHRPCGDIDIYLFERIRGGLSCAQKKGDQILHDEYSIEIRNDKHHHTTFSINGISIENHYDFLNIHSHLSNRLLEVELKKLAEHEETLIAEKAEKYSWQRPNANFNAIFLLRHAAGHFAALEITLRHLLDWALFVRAEWDKIDWQKVINLAEKSGCSRFLYAFNYLSTELLGIDRGLFGLAFNEGSMHDAQLLFDAILYPKKYSDSWLSKLHRWWDNRWKYKMVYRENDITSFFVLLHSHIISPNSTRVLGTGGETHQK